jgi:amino-acid N-acetyltransferase
MIRRATMADAKGIHNLITYYAERGRMLHRSLESVYERLRDFQVCVEGEQVLGCAALQISWKDLGEIRSLAVAPSQRGKGVGKILVRRVAREGRSIGLKKIFALTYEPEFFRRVGFVDIDREALPTKVWRDCVFCPNADDCKEVAMVMELRKGGS